MLLAIKDKAGSNLTNEENDFMLDNSYGEDLEELTAAVMLMARLQPTDDKAKNVPSYDAKAASQVYASSKVHEQVSHRKRNTIIQTTNDDQIDSSIIFDDPFVENIGSMSDHDSNAHDEYHEKQMVAYNVQREAVNQKRVNDEFKKQKDFLQQELETFKNWAKTFEIKTLQYGLGYLNPECLKKVIAAQPKMYDGDSLHSNKLVINSSNSEETLEDAKQKLSAEQKYFSIPSTSDNDSVSEDVPS
ncbi:hypothetical protein Tco_1460720 [Tanacetum coccineum]